MKGRWVLVVACALVFYGNGAAFVESFVNYPSWHLVGEDEFVAFHRFLTPRVLAFLVAPALAGTVMTIIMLWFRPAAVPRWAVWTAIGLQAVVWISTITVQVPIQIQLSELGLSLPLIDRLMETNWWLRRIPYALCAGLFVWMTTKSIESNGQRAA